MKPPTDSRPARRVLHRLALLVSVAGAYGEFGCSHPSTPAITTNPPACCAIELTAPEPTSERSLYQLDSSWTNDAGAALKLTALGGRPQVVVMFFANCEFACPVLVHDLKKIEAALPEPRRSQVGFVLVSFDTARDTPPALATYRKNHELPANWTLLRGSGDDVLELAALLGVKFKPDGRGQFAHSNVITVLNAEGEIVWQQTGLNREAGPAVAVLEALPSAGGR